MRSGIVNLSITNGTMRFGGRDNHEWSSRAHTAGANAYYLSFDGSTVDASASVRWYGFPLRCLSTVLDIFISQKRKFVEIAKR